MPCAAWESAECFDAFIQSPKFQSFKEGLGPYVAGPPDLQLYQAAEGKDLLLSSTDLDFAQVFKIGIRDGEKSMARANGPWDQITQALRVQDEAERYKDPSTLYDALGLRHVDRYHIVLAGWSQKSVCQTHNMDQTLRFGI